MKIKFFYRENSFYTSLNYGLGTSSDMVYHRLYMAQVILIQIILAVLILLRISHPIFLKAFPFN